MKQVKDLLNVLNKLPKEAMIADNHNGTIFVEDKKTKWRKIFSFKEENTLKKGEKNESF